MTRTQPASNHANAEARWLAKKTAVAFWLRKGLCPRAVADKLGVSIRRVTEAHAWDYAGSLSLAFVAPYAGVGKSRSALAALRRAHFAGIACLPVAAVDFAEDATCFGNGKERDLAEERLRRCRTVSILLLDDIDKPKWTPRAEEEFFAVLDERHRRMKLTIWTSNTPTADAGRLWSEERRAAILRRLTDETDIAEVKL